MATKKTQYPVTFDIDYSDNMDRTSTFFRLLWAIPIVIILSMLSGSGGGEVTAEAGRKVAASGGDVVGGLAAATALMILFRQRYPKWWFTFALELNRFSTRVGAYLFLLTDRYPSTEDAQAVHLDVVYPNVKRDLNRWLPLVKWFLAIPHYFALAVLGLVAVVVTVIAWFSILFTGRYPRDMFEFVVGVGRWAMRVNAYAFLLATDTYPPFTLK